MTKQELIKEFEREAEDNLNEIISKVYKPKIYMRMIGKYGHYEAAKRIAISTDTSGFARLWEKYPKLLVENLIVNNKFKLLFTEEEMKMCKRKLTPSK